MDFNLLADSEARSPALSLSDSGTPQHDPGCKGQENSGQSTSMAVINHVNNNDSNLIIIPSIIITIAARENVFIRPNHNKITELHPKKNSDFTLF